MQISDHSPFTFSSPRSRNCRNPRPCLIWPNTGSTVHLYRQPGAVGGEARRRHVVQPDAVLEVAYRILDLGVTAMIGLQFQRLPVPVGDEAVIAVGGEESQLRTGRRLHPSDDEPYRRGVRLGLERGVEPVSKVSNSASVYTVSRRWERRQEDAASRYGPGADVAVAAVS